MFRGGLSDWIRGAQSIIHEWRMLSESIVQTVIAGFILMLISTGCFAWSEMTGQERQTLRVCAQAGFNIAVLSDPTRLVSYRDETGQVWLVRSDKFAESRMVRDALDAMLKGAGLGLAWGFGGMLLIIAALVVFFYIAGRRQSREEYVRGAEIGDGKALGRAIAGEEGGPGVFRIGDVTLPRAFETQHFLFLGASGAGKTQAVCRLLEGVRAAGQRAVVYDINGSFVEKFYRPDRDVILNPLDERCPGWTIWDEVRAGTDYDRLAESLFPEQFSTDNFWAFAPRTVFAAVARKLKAQADEAGRFPTNADLVKTLTLMQTEAFADFCRDTGAAPIIDKDSPKMTGSVRATIAANIRSLEWLPDREGEASFSIRQFITDAARADAWLFITSRNDQLAALRGLITLWVDTATATLLSMKEDVDRRIWLVFDELTSLNRLSALSMMMAQARKFGGCAALGFQSFAQLVEVYRREGAEAVCGNCSTWFLFRPNDPMTAKWASEALGMSEKNEAQEGVSVGRHEMRDGRTLQRRRALRAVVLPSELRNLKNLEYYLSLGRNYPIVRQQMAYRRFARAAAAFVEAERLKASQTGVEHEKAVAKREAGRTGLPPDIALEDVADDAKFSAGGRRSAAAECASPRKNGGDPPDGDAPSTDDMKSQEERAPSSADELLSRTSYAPVEAER